MNIEAMELPPMPEPEGFADPSCGGFMAYTADQMRDFALQARAQVQGEPMAWLHWLKGPVRVFMNKDEAMMELDRLNREYPLDTDDRKMRPLILGDTPPQPAQATQVPLTDLPEGDVTYFDGRGDAVDGYTAERVWEILRSHGITAQAKKEGT